MIRSGRAPGSLSSYILKTMSKSPTAKNSIGSMECVKFFLILFFWKSNIITIPILFSLLCKAIKKYFEYQSE